MPHPLLESDCVECAHKGKVLLQSSTKDIMCVQDSSGNDAGMISLQDLANATIVGCTNNIAGAPSPCTKLVNIPTSICSTLLEINNQKIIIAQAISQVLTDKGSPLILQGEPKAKDIFELDEDIADFDNPHNNSTQRNDESTQPIRLASLASDFDMALSYAVQNQKNDFDKYPQITLTMLREVFDKIKDSEQNKIQILQEIADELNRIKDDKPMYVHYHLDSRARLEHFFAQCYVETWNGELRLAETITKERANTQYSNKYGNRPNTDDGYNYRGRGLLHLTWRSNYINCTAYLRNKGWLDTKVDFEANPQLVTNSGLYALLSAVWVWNTFKINKQKICDIANKQDFIHTDFKFTQYKNGTGAHITLYNISENLSWITQSINGWYGNLKERQKAYIRIKNANIFKDFS